MPDDRNGFECRRCRHITEGPFEACRLTMVGDPDGIAFFTQIPLARTKPTCKFEPRIMEGSSSR